MIPHWIYYGEKRIQMVYLGNKLIFKSQAYRPQQTLDAEMLLTDTELLSAIATACGIAYEEQVMSSAAIASALSEPASIREVMGVKNDAHLHVGKVLLSDQEQISMHHDIKPESLPSAAIKADGAGRVRASGLAEAATLMAQKLLKPAMLDANVNYRANADNVPARSGSTVNTAETAHKGKAYAQKLMRPMSGSARQKTFGKTTSLAAKIEASSVESRERSNAVLHAAEADRVVADTQTVNYIDSVLTAHLSETFAAYGIANSDVYLRPDVMSKYAGEMPMHIASESKAVMLSSNVVPLVAMTGISGLYGVTLRIKEAATIWIAPVQTGNKLKIVSVYEYKQEDRKLIIR